MLFLVLFSLTACSSSKGGLSAGLDGPDKNESTESVDLGTTYIWVDSTRSTLRDASGEELSYIGGGGDVIFSSSAPSGSAIVYAAESEGRIELTYVDIESGTSRVLHTGRAPLVYSSAWSPDEQSFVFGYYAPVEGEGRMSIGKGEIMMLNRGSGRLQKAGCSSSQVVISWPASETLLVRNNDFMYAVSPSDCATRKTTDIRKWHHVTPSPDGQKIAYILRDLVFNKNTREYEPDSMLYVVSAGEEEGTLVVGDRYRPRNMAWSSNSSELVFDVLEKLGADKRVIFIYQIDEDKRFVLNDPSPLNPSESHPSFYGGVHTVYYFADSEYLMVGFTSGIDKRSLRIDENLGKPVGILHLPEKPFQNLVEVESGDVYQVSSRANSAFLLGRGKAIIPERKKQ